ncbi:MAG: GTA-gp10 family protein [Pseudomonadota bacterium]
MSRPDQATLAVNGEPRVLRLTLGALAEIETALGGGDFDALQARLQRPSVGDLLLIVHALLAGGGAAISFEALKTAEIDLSDAAAAVAEAFAAFSSANMPTDDPGADAMEAPGKSAAPHRPRAPIDGHGSYTL